MAQFRMWMCCLMKLPLREDKVINFSWIKRTIFAANGKMTDEVNLKQFRQVFFQLDSGSVLVPDHHGAH